MKTIAFGLVATFCFTLSSLSQTLPCGTSSKSGKAYVITKQMLQSRLVNVPYCVRTYITVFADNNGNNRAASDEAIIRLFDQMVLSYKPYSICFMLMGIKQVNNSDLLYQDKSEESELDPFKKVGMLNVFIHLTVSDGTRTIGGTSYDIPNTGHYCSISSGRLTYPDDNSTMAHEVGHVFGLYHTFEPHPWDPFHGKESAERNTTFFCYDCEEDGDLVCDTQADPDQDLASGQPSYLEAHTDANCVYNGTNVDECNNVYHPATNNIMSYGRVECLTFLTYGQGERMKATIANEPGLRTCMADDNATFGVAPPLFYNSNDNYLNARDQLNGLGFIQLTSSSYLQMQAKKIVLQQNIRFSPGAGGRVVLKTFNGCD